VCMVHSVDVCLLLSREKEFGLFVIGGLQAISNFVVKTSASLSMVLSK
jgi:hypothetical protein